MSLIFQLFLSFAIMIAANKYLGRDHDRRSIRLLGVFVGLWTFGYGILGPIVIYISGLDSVLPNFEYMGLASIMLSISYTIFLFVYNQWSVKVALIKEKRPARFSSILCLSIIFFAGTAAVPSQSGAKLYFATIMLIPSICLLYIYARRKSQLMISVSLHLITAYFCLQDEFFLSSKERIILITIFPPLFLMMVRNRITLNFRWVSACLLVIAVFLGSSVIVSSTRIGNEVTIGDGGSGFIAERLIASAGRLGVVDTAGALIKNELSNDPIRPTMPIWSLVGTLFSVVPATFERPNHPREMLPLAGYITSHDEVNLAGTTAGHLLWSYGWIGLIPSLLFFWCLFFSFVHVIITLPKPFSELALISTLVLCLRLETTANVFLGSVFASVIVYLALSLLTLLVRACSMRARDKGNYAHHFKRI